MGIFLEHVQEDAEKIRTQEYTSCFEDTSTQAQLALILCHLHSDAGNHSTHSYMVSVLNHSF